MFTQIKNLIQYYKKFMSTHSDTIDVDKIINISEENKATITPLLQYLNKAVGIFDSMIETGIIFDKFLSQLKNDICREQNGINKLIKERFDAGLLTMIEQMRSHLLTTISSESGEDFTIIRPNPDNEGNKTASYSITFKLPKYSWISGAQIGTIDNISITTFQNKKDLTIFYEFKIGTDTIIIHTSNSEEFPSDQFDIKGFVRFINEIILKVRLIDSLFDKNVKTIENSRGFISRLVKTFNLF